MKRYGVVFLCMCLILAGPSPSIHVPASPHFGPTTQPRLEHSYLPHAPIRISSDADFVAQGWPGLGTPADPFVIAGLEIENYSHCIEINNTQSLFCIRECKLVIGGLAACIYLNHVENGEIYLNNITGPSMTGFGVWLVECNGTLIHHNQVLQRVALSASTRCQVTNNAVNERGRINLLYSDYNTIANNSMTGEGTNIIVDASSNNIVNGNFLNQSQVRLQRGSNSNQLIGNTITFSSQIGLEIQPGCTSNTISWNALAFNSPGDVSDNGNDNTFDYNFYSDYEGTDWNFDGIGDIPHYISGMAGSVDLHPLMAPPGVPPPNPLLQFILAALPLVIVVVVVLMCCVVYLLFRRRYA